MKKHYQVIKRCVMIFCSFCIIFSLVFLAQIQEQKRQMQTLQNLGTETKLDQELAYKQQLILTYEENGQAMKGLAEKISALQPYYDKGMYLDSLAVELDREKGSKSCIERYFKIEKGELEKILGETNLTDQLQAELPDVYQWGCLLPVGDRIWVQYDEDDAQNTLPTGVVIQNPLIDIGYDCLFHSLYGRMYGALS